MEKMKRLVTRLVMTAALGTLVLPVIGAPVIGVADGDTLTVLVDGKPLRIRLGNIDAPEKKQAFGDRSKLSLSELCYRRDAAYSILGVDRYGRTIATVLCDGVDVNHAQVERGMAWVYTQYNKDRELPGIEAKAKAAKRGLWVDRDPVQPWKFRHTQ